MENKKERKILEGIRDGNEIIIKEFYLNNLKYIRGYILRNSGCQEDVEDVFQDALVLVYQKLTSGSLEVNSSLQSYFYGICKNLWRNRLRKKSKLILNDTLITSAEHIDISISDRIEDNEQLHLYQRHFLKLSDANKKLLNLFFEGKSMREISGITGYTEGYARKKKFESKKNLIEMIEKDPLYQELKTVT